MDRDQTAGPPAPVRRSAEDWRELVREFETSGETLKAWCGGRGYSAKTLSNWRSRLRGGGAPAFVAVADSGPSAAPADMRMSFDGLSALVRTRLGRDPVSGAL